MRRVLSVSAIVVAVAGLTLSSVAALAEPTPSQPEEALPRPDGKPPRLKVKPIEFIVGASIDATEPWSGECDILGEWHHEVPMRLSWVGKDGRKPVDHYDVWAIPASSEPFQIIDDSDQTSVDLLGGDYDSDCGDAPTSRSHRVEAYDGPQDDFPLGNVAMAEGDSNINMGAWQEDGFSHYWASERVTMAWSGTWTPDSCTCSDAGHTTFSTTAGDSVTFTVRPRVPGQSFALVMPMDADRGEVEISVDGAAPEEDDTYAESAQHRTIVWQTKLTRGKHTVVVTNLGTPDRSRIDIDAVLVS